MKKIKAWLKKHKKEIIVGVVAASGTAIYFLVKENKVGIKAGINLSLRFLDGFDNEEEWYCQNGRSDLYTNINLNKPDLTLSDLGKLGDVLKENIPMIMEDSKINRITVNYNQLKK